MQNYSDLSFRGAKVRNFYDISLVISLSNSDIVNFAHIKTYIIFKGYVLSDKMINFAVDNR